MTIQHQMFCYSLLAHPSINGLPSPTEREAIRLPRNDRDFSLVLTPALALLPATSATTTTTTSPAAAAATTTTALRRLLHLDLARPAGEAQRLPLAGRRDSAALRRLGRAPLALPALGLVVRPVAHGQPPLRVWLRGRVVVLGQARFPLLLGGLLLARFPSRRRGTLLPFFWFPLPGGCLLLVLGVRRGRDKGRHAGVQQRRDVDAGDELPHGGEGVEVGLGAGVVAAREGRDQAGAGDPVGGVPADHAAEGGAGGGEVGGPGRAEELGARLAEQGRGGAAPGALPVRGGAAELVARVPAAVLRAVQGHGQGHEARRVPDVLVVGAAGGLDVLEEPLQHVDGAVVVLGLHVEMDDGEQETDVREDIGLLQHDGQQLEPLVLVAQVLGGVAQVRGPLEQDRRLGEVTPGHTAAAGVVGRLEGLHVLPPGLLAPLGDQVPPALPLELGVRGELVDDQVRGLARGGGGARVLHEPRVQRGGLVEPLGAVGDLGGDVPEGPLGAVAVAVVVDVDAAVVAEEGGGLVQRAGPVQRVGLLEGAAGLEGGAGRGDGAEGVVVALEAQEGDDLCVLGSGVGVLGGCYGGVGDLEGLVVVVYARAREEGGEGWGHGGKEEGIGGLWVVGSFGWLGWVPPQLWYAHYGLKGLGDGQPQLEVDKVWTCVCDSLDKGVSMNEVC
ncbi:hypothetical protein VSDG_09922 [Cytospora chrysosperma]|uniref:Uncharacterized protein n=1 Tax=Cytospora chrysosperma TaxID=252740 RepID=A0A423V9E4_CYTCH|nr:hypothetical protein VSDG_09922 [Valsa sordida]